MLKQLLGLREHVTVDKENVAVTVCAAPCNQHGLNDRRRFVEHRGVCGLHSGEVGDHGLEVDDCFQSALRDLWLVGGVGGIPAGVL